MEQVPAWLEATINAAGMATVYNADDWSFDDKSEPDEKGPSKPH